MAALVLLEAERGPKGLLKDLQRDTAETVIQCMLMEQTVRQL